MILDSGFGILAIYSLLSKGLLLQIGETDGPSHRWDYSSSEEGEMAERSAAIYSSSIVSKGLPILFNDIGDDFFNRVKSIRRRLSQRGCCSSPCCRSPRPRSPCSTPVTSSLT